MVLLLAAAVVLSGCVGQGTNVLQNIMDIKLSGGGVEDTTITAKVPEFARANRDFDWQLAVQPAIDIRNFRTEIYETGLFDVVGSDPLNKSEINGNRTELFSIKYHMGDPGLAQQTAIKMRSFYTSNATTSTTVVALSETEYFQRKQADTLSTIPVSTWTSTNPLLLTVTWSDPMPLLDAQAVQMYVDYQNLGSGYIEKLSAGQVTFTLPTNIEFVSCDDYNLTDGKLFLKRDLDFLQKRAKRSTCTFKAKASGTIDSQSIVGTALYDYEIDNTVTVPIIQK
jgi:hypothetical protein